MMSVCVFKMSYILTIICWAKAVAGCYQLTYFFVYFS